MVSLSKRSEGLSESVYRVAATPPRPPIPLDVGDTHLAPFAIAHDASEVHGYTPTPGLDPLRSRIAEHVSAMSAARGGRPVSAEQVVVTAGGTAALAALAGAVLDPGDDLLIIAPHWPLIASVATCAGGNAVRVPWFDGELCSESLTTALEAHLSPRAKAVYVNPTHSPTGRLLPQECAESLVNFARKHDLWIFSDDVYELFVYGDRPSPSFLALAPERTVTVGSASKAYGLAGARVGWVAGNTELVRAALKFHINSGYCAPRWGQGALLQALEGEADGWVSHARALYEETGRKVAKLLGAPEPESSTFLFVDVSAALESRTLTELLTECMMDGVAFAPGPSFGPYPHHARICFTSAPPEDVLTGVGILASKLRP